MNDATTRKNRLLDELRAMLSDSSVEWAYADREILSIAADRAFGVAYQRETGKKWDPAKARHI